MNIKEKLLVVAGKNLENMICIRNAKAGFLFTKVLPDYLVTFSVAYKTHQLLYTLNVIGYIFFVQKTNMLKKINSLEFLVSVSAI